MDNPPNHYPDGLTQTALDALMAEVFSQVIPVVRPMPPFADREAELRRERRRANRAMARAARMATVVAESSRRAA